MSAVAGGRDGGEGEARAARPFDAVRSRLIADRDISHQDTAGTPLRLDPERRLRTGIPEIVLAVAKPPPVVRRALLALAAANGRALASRCEEAHFAAVSADLPAGYRAELHPEAAAVVLIDEAHPRALVPPTGGRVGVLAAGASDARVAAEASLVAREMGCLVEDALDVGVAGLHRLVGPLEAMIGGGADALVVVAGMDGALPSVVAGLVDVPVVGVPTSTGYGLGGAGEAAILAMLQSCALGLVVVNIDNGIGGGAAAARIANRAALARTVVAGDNTNDHDRSSL